MPIHRLQSALLSGIQLIPQSLFVNEAILHLLSVSILFITWIIREL